MNRKGQTVFAGIIVALMIFMFGILFINFFKTDITAARVDLSCSAPDNISDGTKFMCLLLDVPVLYWIIIIISFAGGVLTEPLTT